MPSQPSKSTKQYPYTVLQDQLRLALNDVYHGIVQYKILPEDPETSSRLAQAEVDLYEGNQVKISVCKRGYYIGDDEKPERYHGSVEGILMSVSPEFESRRAGMLGGALG